MVFQAINFNSHLSLAQCRFSLRADFVRDHAGNNPRYEGDSLTLNSPSRRKQRCASADCESPTPINCCGKVTSAAANPRASKAQDDPNPEAFALQNRFSRRNRLNVTINHNAVVSSFASTVKARS